MPVAMPNNYRNDFLPIYSEWLQDGLNCPERTQTSNPESIDYLRNFVMINSDNSRWMDAFRKYLSSAYEPVCERSEISIAEKEATEDAARMIAGVMLFATGAFIFFPEATDYFFSSLAE